MAHLMDKKEMQELLKKIKTFKSINFSDFVRISDIGNSNSFNYVTKTTLTIVNYGTNTVMLRKWNTAGKKARILKKEFYSRL